MTAASEKHKPQEYKIQKNIVERRERQRAKSGQEIEWKIKLLIRNSGRFRCKVTKRNNIWIETAFVMEEKLNAKTEVNIIDDNKYNYVL